MRIIFARSPLKFYISSLNIFPLLQKGGLVVCLLAIYISIEAKAENVKTEKVSQDCIDLTIMTKLAEIAEDKAESIKIIRQLKFNACDLGINLGQSFSYPNGQTAKWYDNWNYPNGQTAKWYDNWNYPNGNSAGAVGILFTYACSKLDEQACRSRLSDFKSMDTSLQDLTAIELAWLAYKTEQNQQKKN